MALTQSAMKEKEATSYLKKVMPDIKKIFFQGKKPISGFGLEISPNVHIINSNQVNAEQWVRPEKKGIMRNGVSVTNGLLKIRNKDTIKFALLHEMGHLLTLQFISKFKLKLTGVQLEIIADLSSIFLMKKTGISWSRAKKSISDWKQSQIFDNTWSGPHPPGGDRVKIINKFISLMKQKENFKKVTKTLMRKTRSYREKSRLPKL